MHRRQGVEAGNIPRGNLAMGVDKLTVALPARPGPRWGHCRHPADAAAPSHPSRAPMSELPVSLKGAPFCCTLASREKPTFRSSCLDLSNLAVQKVKQALIPNRCTHAFVGHWCASRKDIYLVLLRKILWLGTWCRHVVPWKACGLVETNLVSRLNSPCRLQTSVAAAASLLLHRSFNECSTAPA
jgi:hypothetical protein